MKRQSRRTEYRNVLKFFLLLRPYWKNILVFILTGLVLTLLSLPYPWLTKIMIDDVMLKQDVSLLYVLLSATFFLSVFRALFSAVRNYYISFIQHAMAYDIELKIFRHLQTLSFSFFDSREVPEILTRFRDAIQSRRILIDVLNRMVTNLLYLSIVPVIVFFMNWRLALIAGVTLPWLIFSFLVLSRVVRRYSRLLAEKRAEISARNHEFFSGIRDIQSLNIQGRILNRFKLLLLVFRKKDMEMRVVNTFQGLFGGMATALGTMLYTWYGATQVIQGLMTVGELIAFTTFIGYLYNPLTDVIKLLVPIQEVVVYTRRFYELFDLEPDIQSPENPKSLENLRGEICFSNVCFGYVPGQPALQHINVRIPAGSTVAVVGRTGSGKSTLTRLIPRFYDPDDGVVSIDGLDVRELSLQYLRGQVGVMMQYPFMFSGSVFNNITCWKKGFDRRQVIDAAKAANAHEFISRLPKGYDTMVGEKGETLSGGERQRIALARIFLLDRPILILDEALSSVDKKTQYLILDAVKKISQGRTVLMVTHKIEIAKDADLILVADQGRIAEQGRHRELMALGGIYHELYTRRA